MLSHFSHTWLFVTLWTAAHQSLLPMGVFRQEYRVGCYPLLQGTLPNPGIKPISPASPASQGISLPLGHWGSPKCYALTFIFLLSCPEISWFISPVSNTLAHIHWPTLIILLFPFLSLNNLFIFQQILIEHQDISGIVIITENREIKNTRWVLIIVFK